jgi:hypothetical protein
MSTTKTPPVHEVRAGRMRAAIWANPSEKGVWHSVTLSRLYKDGDEWKDSQTRVLQFSGRSGEQVAEPRAGE